MGYGYGSEWQLTRFLGRHRSRFTSDVGQACDLQSIEWLDFDFTRSNWLGDGEILGLDFLPDSSTRETFRAWWPHGSGIMNWDAVGHGLDVDGEASWILVEAKGNIPELRSDCGAGPDSMRRIRAALDETSRALGVTDSEDWTQRYYQHANRLAVLYFLMKHGVSAHLVDVLFQGSTDSDGRSPANQAEWGDALDEMSNYLGLKGESELERRVHTVFIDISGV
jgi:hypothetical protein